MRIKIAFLTLLMGAGLLVEGGYFPLRLAVLLSAGFLLWKFFERFSPFQNALWVLGLTGLLGMLNLQWGNLANPDSLMWWTLSRGQAEDVGWILYRPKLYAWYLRLIPEYTWVPASHLLLRLLTVGAFLWLASCFRWPKPLAPLLALFLGINSLWLQEQNQILDTTLFTLLCLLCLATFLKAWKQPSPVNLLMYGLSAGLCTLTRQLMDPFLFAGFALLFSRSHFWPSRFWHSRFGKHPRDSRQPSLASWKSLVCALAVFFLVGWMGLWIHWVQLGVPKRTVALGVNLFTHASYYQWENPSEEEKALIRELIHENPIRESTSKDPEAKRWNTHYTINISWFANALPHIYQRHLESRGLTRPESDKLLRNKYFQWIRHNPGLFLYSWWNEGRRFLFKTEEYAPFSQLSRLAALPPWMERLEKYLYHIPLWLLVALGLAGLFIRPSIAGVVRGLTAGASSDAARAENHVQIPLVASLTALLVPFAYFAMIAAIHMGFTRYTLPMLPFLYLSAGFCLSTLLTVERGERQVIPQTDCYF